jgi:hypothetical protein
MAPLRVELPWLDVEFRAGADLGCRRAHHLRAADLGRLRSLSPSRHAAAPYTAGRLTPWTTQEISAHVLYMRDFAARLEGTGEFVDGLALAPEGTWVRYDGEGSLAGYRRPVC